MLPIPLKGHTTPPPRVYGGYYTSGQVATICSVAARTVGKWTDSGLLKAHRLPGSLDRRIHHEDLLEFLRDHGMGRTIETLRAQISGVLLVGADPVFGELLSTQLGKPVHVVPCAGSAGAHCVRYCPRIVVLVLSTLGYVGGEALRRYLATLDPPLTVVPIYPEDQVTAPGGLQEPVSVAALAEFLKKLLTEGKH